MLQNHILWYPAFFWYSSCPIMIINIIEPKFFVVAKLEHANKLSFVSRFQLSVIADSIHVAFHRTISVIRENRFVSSTDVLFYFTYSSVFIFIFLCACVCARARARVYVCVCVSWLMSNPIEPVLSTYHIRCIRWFWCWWAVVTDFFKRKGF